MSTGSMQSQNSLTDVNHVAFHRAEYSALKLDMSELVKQINTNLGYAFFVPGAIAAWLLRPPGSPTDAAPSIHYIAYWLPFGVCFLFGNLVFFANQRRERKASYVRQLEERLGDPELGYERQDKTYRVGWFERMHKYTLFILYAVWVFVGLLYGIPWNG